MTGMNVPPAVLPLTVDDTRNILAKPLLALCADHGPTRVALAIGGANEKTVREARDEISTLRLDYAANLLLLDGTAFDGFLAHVGRRSVPMEARCDVDVMVTTSAALHHIAEGRSPLSPGGVEETEDELLAQEPVLEAAMEGLIARLSRIGEIKAARDRRGRAAA